MSVRIYLSAVSNEFRDYRDHLRAELTRHNVEVKVQEDFRDRGGVTLDKLDFYVRESDAVVHLIGDMTGADANPASIAAILARYPDIADKLPPLKEALQNAAGISYAQWEAWLALYHNKVLLIAQADPSAPRGPKYAPTDASRTAQHVHLKRLAQVERFPGFRFTSPDNLASRIAYTVILDLLAEDRAKGAPRGGVDNLRDTANSLRATGRVEEALALYERIVQQFPDNPVGLAGLAETLRSLGRLDESRALYERMVQQFPNDPAGLFGLAETLRASGRIDEARVLYERLVQQFPDNSLGIIGLAEMLRAEGRPAEALAIYERATHQFPDNSVALIGLAETLRELGRDEQAAAVEDRAKGAPTDVKRPSDVRGDIPPVGELTPTHSTAPFYSDHPAKRDSLNRKAVAETIATMIENVWNEDIEDDNADRAFMVHLHGRWGSGKTSILNFLREALLSQTSNSLSKSDGRVNNPAQPSWIVVEYGAWRNQNLGPAWWTLMNAVYGQARDQLGGWRSRSGLWLILSDRWWRVRCSYAPYALAAALALVFGLMLIWLWRTDLFGPDKPWVADGLKIIGSVIGLIVAVFAFGHNYQIGSARTAKSYLELSRDPLGPLTKRYGELVADIDRPVAVFVDDLDRCNAEFVVELLQTIQTLFRHARVLYVIAADRDWVCASYQQQYKTFSDSLGEQGKSLGHLFLEKVFQLSIEVPRLGTDERDIYWDGLINSRLPTKLEQTKQIAAEIAAELESAKTEADIVQIVEQYRNDPIRAEIAASKGFRQMHSAAIIKERKHFLAGYAHLIEPNPRAMKRLLNAYGFRRGFDILSRRRSDPDALVRWTILENRWPILADHLEGRSSGRDETDVINALMRNPDVREVAGDLTWERLRPVASAPDGPPAPEITPGPEPKTGAKAKEALDSS